MKKNRFPTAYTILFVLIILAAAATWLVPAGTYDRVLNPLLERQVPVPGSYHEIPQQPQGLLAILQAPIAGLYDFHSGAIRAIDISIFVLMIGGFLGIVSKTGALDAGLTRVLARLKGRETLMIPILMACFAAGGTIFGMAEETLAFYALIVPIMLRAGYDSLVGAAILILGAGIGALGSTINPFATVIASNAAGIPFTQGLGLRFLILIIGFIICAGWVMRYASKVRRFPELSLVFDRREILEHQFLNDNDLELGHKLSLRHKLVLLTFAATFVLLVIGTASLGWWMGEMSALFFSAALLIGFIERMNERDFVEHFIEGAKELLGVALIVGLARGIVVVMDQGAITDTLLFWAASALDGLGKAVFINLLFFVEFALSFLIPSTSGLAVLTMPILAPLASFSNVPADLVVTAYQSASGLVNLITPTSAVVIGGLAIAQVPYVRWLKFMVVPFLALLALILLSLSLSL
ncbi:YfcC family protein [Polycladidibacter hongkongensis]|uniref:YfcC family protein n=1 Tax=Polycladidibacter hongkongensis TaxID=1647556 RepID=UPI000836A020|nr:YfcC family protein [Pseudovibrio hongkongensis]